MTLHLIDELAERPGVPPPALAEVRALVIEERERRRAVMLERLKRRRHRTSWRGGCEAVRAGAARRPTPAHNWRGALALRIARRGRRLEKAIEQAGQIYAPEALHQVRIAAKKLRYALEIADESGAAPCAPTRCARSSASRTRSAGCTICRCCSTTSPPSARRRAAAASTPDAGLGGAGAADRRRVPSPARALRRGDAGAARGGRDGARRDVPVRLTRAPAARSR